jgi:hypothetical protein
MEVSGQLHVPSALLPRERAPGIHWIGGWVGPRAVMDALAERLLASQKGLCSMELVGWLVS